MKNIFLFICLVYISCDSLKPYFAEKITLKCEPASESDESITFKVLSAYPSKYIFLEKKIIYIYEDTKLLHGVGNIESILYEKSKKNNTLIIKGYLAKQPALESLFIEESSYGFYLTDY